MISKKGKVMEKMRFTYSIVVVILIVFAVVFYWYGYRPSSIRKYCAGFVKENEGHGEKTNLDSAFGYQSERDGAKYYSNCLHLKGL